MSQSSKSSKASSKTSSRGLSTASSKAPSKSSGLSLASAHSRFDAFEKAEQNIEQLFLQLTTVPPPIAEAKEIMSDDSSVSTSDPLPRPPSAGHIMQGVELFPPAEDDFLLYNNTILAILE